MSRADNDNVNAGFLKENNNVNDNAGRHCNKRNPERKVDTENIADDLVRRLNNPNAYRFYLKIAWHLPPAVIYSNLEKAQAGRDPVRLFTWLCKSSMASL